MEVDQRGQGSPHSGPGPCAHAGITVQGNRSNFSKNAQDVDFEIKHPPLKNVDN